MGKSANLGLIFKIGEVNVNPLKEGDKRGIIW
jgi:hypothetical protein